MKALIGILVLGLAVTGCTQQHNKASGAAKTPAEPTFSASADQLSAAVRVLGVGSWTQGAVLLRVSSLEVTLQGKPLAVQIGADPIDLTQQDNAFLAGRFQVPRNASQVHVKLTLDDFGGWESPAGAGVIDARGAAIEFDAPVAWLAQRGHAVVQLDAARSLVDFGRAGEGRKLLLPQVAIAY